MIIGRKFSLLSNIDIAQITAEKQADVKKRIIHEKFKRNLLVWSRRTEVFLKPIIGTIYKGGSFLYNRLINLKDNYEQVDRQESGDLKHTESLLAEADDCRHKGDTAKAESLLIEAIGIDAKNYKAFQMLGELYLDRNNHQEAEETLQHAIRLLEQHKKLNPELVKDSELSKAYFSLCAVADVLSDQVKALSSVQKALDLEPNSPRYLDKACEICLNLKNGPEALNYCRRLERVNPGNKKLKEIKDKIREMVSGEQLVLEE